MTRSSGARTNPALADVLLELRRLAGLTQEDLAERAELTTRAISYLESGRVARPRRSTVERLITGLALPPEAAARLWTLTRGHPPPEPTSGTGRSGGHVPAQLPAEDGVFCGRDAQIAALDRALRTGSDRDGHHRASTVVVCGMPGVGKSALALRWAHARLDAFPEGQLHVDLRGHDIAAPRTPADVLAGFLRALGTPEADIPVSLDDRVAVYRTLLSRRRVLVVLDNAATSEQVRPLLPPSQPCVVTSRNRLAGLVARNGATRVELPPLSVAESCALLGHILRDRPDADALPALARHCTGLPLALRIVAELASTRPPGTLGRLAVEVEDERARLDLLVAEDHRTDVRSVFSWSFASLAPRARAAFRLIGCHPGPRWSATDLAALAAGEVGAAEACLDILVRGHLVERVAGRRYRAHDLLRLYAAELAPSGPERRVALARLFDHYQAAAAAAMDLVAPHERDRRPVPPVVPTAPRYRDDADARRWLDAELDNLHAIVAAAAGEGLPRHAAHLAMTVRRHLESAGRYEAGGRLLRDGLDAARACADRTAEAACLNGLGVFEGIHFHDEAAVRHLRTALAISVDLGDRQQELSALGSIGLLHLRAGRLAAAHRLITASVRISREIGDRAAESYGLSNLGTISRWTGRLDEALEHEHRSLELARELGDRLGEAVSADSLGDILWAMGRFEAAHVRHREALDLANAIGNQRVATVALTGMARALDSLNGPDATAHGRNTAQRPMAELGLVETPGTRRSAAAGPIRA